MRFEKCPVTLVFGFRETWVGNPSRPTHHKLFQLGLNPNMNTFNGGFKYRWVAKNAFRAYIV